MTKTPYAIAMWDFSWLERRWPGAGYEDWDLVLDELAERGYDAVRIDAYPHLVSADAEKTWDILPVWDQMNWGAQSRIQLRILPDLITFMQKAKDRSLGVALSTWYRRDVDDIRLRIQTPQDQAKIWIDTLVHLERADLLDCVLFVDLCNEFPVPIWTPYLYGGPKGVCLERSSPRLVDWMAQSIALLRERFPSLDYTYSFCNQYTNWAEQDVSMLDILEPHIWMASDEVSAFYKVIEYKFDHFEPTSTNNLVRLGETEYRQNQAHYDAQLVAGIANLADWSRASGKALVTTECWSVIDFKDWPGLNWDWVKALCELGVTTAAATGRWTGMATSNFCGPQYRGMWRDIAWHQRLTTTIHNAHVDESLLASRPARP